MSTHWTERLSEYHDGELAAAEQAECTAHLADCASCREVLAELQAVVGGARADADVAPTADLWPGILTRIDGTLRASARRRHVTFSLPQLALAASLLMAVSAGVAYVAAGRSINRPAVEEAPIQAMAESMGAPSSDITPANFADAEFDRAVTDLERILVGQRQELDPRTVMIIERNLTVIDDAIRQARAALDADPANTFLNSHLADARRRKLELLRKATSIAGD